MPQTWYAEAINRIQTPWLFVRWLWFFPVLCPPSSLFLFQQGPKCNMMQSVATGARPCTLLRLPLARLLRAQKEEKVPHQHALTTAKSINSSQYPEKSLPFEFIHICKINDACEYVEELLSKVTIYCSPICRNASNRLYIIMDFSMKYLLYSNASNQKRAFSTKQNWPFIFQFTKTASGGGKEDVFLKTKSPTMLHIGICQSSSSVR